MLLSSFALAICLQGAYYMLTMSSFDQNIVSTLLSYREYMIIAKAVSMRCFNIEGLGPLLPGVFFYSISVERF